MYEHEKTSPKTTTGEFSVIRMWTGVCFVFLRQMDNKGVLRLIEPCPLGNLLAT